MKIELKDLSKKIVEYAIKKKVLKYSPQSEEEYSLDNPDGSTLNRKGFMATDITGFWMPSSIKDYYQANISAFQKNYDEFGFLNTLSLMPIQLPWSGWVWVIDSLETIKYDILDDQRRIANKIESARILKNYDALLKTITNDQILEKVNEDYHQILPQMWIAKNDPTVIIYDPNFKPYAYKDGWSKEQLGEILQEWFKEVSSQDIKTVFVENASW